MTGESEKILVVDDEERMCHSLYELLTADGYDVTTSQSGKTAIELIREKQFSLVLTDIKMPEIGGMDILRAARDVDPEIIVILMTGYASLETSLDAIKSGAFEYLLKPVEFTQLEISVERGLEKRKASLARKKLLNDLQVANLNLYNRLEEINALYEAATSIGSSYNIRELLNKILKLAASVTQSDLGSIMLVDPTGQYLTIEAYIGLEPEIAAAVKLPIGSSIAGYVAQHGEPIIISDVEKDERFQRINKERYSSSSLLSVPLKVTNDILGVINMANRKDGSRFDDHDLKLLTTFASQAAISINDARLFENNKRKLKEFSILFEMSNQLSRVGSVSAMRNVVFENMKKLLPIDFALWFEWRPMHKSLRPVGVTGTDIPLTESGSINLEMVKGEDLNLENIDLSLVDVNDTKALSKYIASQIDSYSLYPKTTDKFTALSVMQEGELRYIFCIDSTDGGRFTDQDISLVKLMVAQATGFYEREKALLNATRLLTMGNMISEISHDLRKPLTNIKGWIQILGEKWPEVAADAQFFHMAEEEIQRLNELVKELVDFSKPQKYETELRDIRSVIRRAAELIKPDMRKKNVSFKEQFEDCNWEIPINKNQILEVFLNLFLNAIDAISDNGEIAVTGKVDRPDFKKTDFLAVTVSDTGKGIKKENLSRIFDRYYTTKETGTGLGLAVVERIITAHGGTLAVRSEEGKGTSFTLYFPI
jgi:signal transduction histidine kinase/FixJ family two-component response regulator